ncbi:MAG: hypothetical protein JKY01_05000 [Pseudomonadales bacterium]|nr:hypothetical protein [Pseudomonadales bacterium]
MNRLIRKRMTLYFLLAVLLGQFIGASWSCTIEEQASPRSSAFSLHGEHQAHSQTRQKPVNEHSVYQTKESPDSATSCCNDDSPCSTHHCSTIYLAHSFETLAASPRNKLHPPLYTNSIKRAPLPLYRPPILPLSQA